MNSFKLILIGIPLFWTGFVSAISFMEAWLKFRAEGVTIPIGLSIGKKVFPAMNRVEWTLLILYTVAWVSLTTIRVDVTTILSSLLFIILMVQTFYLLPSLNKRAEMLIGGRSIEKSAIHLYFVCSELLKVVTLIVLSAYNYLH